MPTTEPTLTAAQLAELVRSAVLAPSSHNTQPWRFRLEPGVGIALYADRTRALPVNDPDDRELVISCGAALLNLRVAAAAAGLEPRVRLLPEPAEPDLLARVALVPGTELAADAALAEAIVLRRTYRRRFRSEPVAEQVLDELAHAVSSEGAWLHVLATDQLRSAAAALVAEGDAAQWANPSWRRELAVWLHPRRRGDGLSLPGLVAPVAQAVVRSFDMGGGVAARDRQLADESPVLAVLGTSADGEADRLAAGQALQRLLLQGCRRGLQASYLNQAVQVPALRIKLQQLLGRGGFPQLLLRLGVPEGALPASPRRPLEAVLG